MIDEKEIVLTYQQGLDIRQVAAKFNLSYEKTRKILKDNKVQWRRKYVSDFTPEEIEKCLKMFDSGESIAKIAKWFEISGPAISKLMIANGRAPDSSTKKYDVLRAIPISKKQQEIIVGTLLGDGCLYRDKESDKYNYKLSISQCKKQEQYFHWKRMMLDPFINAWRENEDKRKNSVMLHATTIVHPELNRFGKMFYINRIKTIPTNLDMWMTPLSLAVWVMDDGNLNAGVNMRIASMGFTYEENIQLRDLLKRVFDLRCKVMEYKRNNISYYLLTFNKQNTQKLSDIIRPYIIECMQYKIMSVSSETTCQTPEKDEDIVRPSPECEESTRNE